MATIQELFRSRDTVEGDSPSIDFNYLIKGTDSDIAAKLALDSLTPSEYDGLVKESLSVQVLGLDSWRGQVKYSKRKKKEHGDSRYSFDTKGATQHVTQALEVIGVYVPEGASAPDFHGTIGATKDGVEGADIILPQFSFSETHYFDPAWINDAYKYNLYYLTGTVNAAPFRSMAKGECLFEGASGSRTGDAPDDLWEIAFSFRGSPNAVGLPIGPEISVPAKEGWQYLDVHYEDQVDEVACRLVKRPYAVQLARLYQYGNFGVLGI